jgi:predicted metalloprotease with PDZ domain
MSSPIEFEVSAAPPTRRRLSIRMTIPDISARETLEVSLPVWTPGSYLVREYARHVQSVTAQGPDGQRRDVTKRAKSTWRVECDGLETVVVEYDIYAHELNVREKHVDASHAFYQPTAVFMHPEGALDRPVELHVAPAVDDWSVYCPLPAVDGARHRWRADDFHMLYDAPLEMGDHDELTFEVDGTEHTVVFWGEGNWDRDRLERDLPRVVAANAEMFGGLPYDDYLFITLLSDGSYGGLEHRNSTALIYPRDQFGRADSEDEPPIDDEDYQNFLSLVAHEHFHVWNVKRIRPQALASIDYLNENYLRELWTVEGITSYYDTRALLRAGLIDADGYLDSIAKGIRRLEQTPGRRVQSLADASFDAWIKYYRRDEQTPNNTVSYYLKGSLVALLLDLRIRRATDGKRALDDVMTRLFERWEAEPSEGYAPGTHEALASKVAGQDLSTFFDTFIRGTEDPDWDAELAAVGLELNRELDEETPEAWLGVRTEIDAGRPSIRSIRDDGPSAQVDLAPGDTLLAIDGYELSEQRSLSERLCHVEPGQSVTLHGFREGRLFSTEVVTGTHPPDEYAIRLSADATEAQRELLKGWVGTDDISTEESPDA